QLDDPRMPAAEQLVRGRILALEREPLRAVLEIGEQHRTLLAEVGNSCQEPRILLLDEDVDLAAAGETDLERLLVRDAVGEELRRAAAQDVPACLVDLGLDAAPGHGTLHGSFLRDVQLRPDRPRGGSASGDDGRDGSALHAPYVTGRTRSSSGRP